MPGGTENIKGIGVSVTADVGQVKSTIEQAFAGLKDRKVQITLTPKLEGTFEAEIRRMRQTKVSLDVAFAPTRDSIRQIRRTVKQRMDAEGAIQVAVTAAAPSQREGARIRRAIKDAVGSPKVELVIDWKWGRSGPPPAGGGGAGGGPGFSVPPGQMARQGIAPPNQFADLVRELKAAMAARGAMGTPQPAQAAPAEEAPAPAGAAAAPARQPRGRRQPRKPREARQPREERVPAVDTSLPERINAETGEVVRGPASVGPLAADVRRSVQGAGGPVPAGFRRNAAGRLINARTNRFASKDEVSKAMAGLGVGRPEQEEQAPLLTVERVLQELRTARRGQPKDSEAYKRLSALINLEQGELGSNRGFRGQRPTRSGFGRGTELTPAQLEARRAQNVERVGAGGGIDAFIEEIESDTIRRPDFRQDEAVMSGFRQRWAPPRRDARGRFLDAKGRQMARQERDRQLFGGAFMRSSDLLSQGEIGTALFGTGVPGDEDELGAVQARARLMAQARNKQIPGVGPGTLRYLQAPNRADIPMGKMSDAQLAFITQIDGLTAIIEDGRKQLAVEFQDASRGDAGRQGAATRQGDRQGMAPRTNRETAEMFEARRQATMGMPQRPTIAPFQGPGFESETKPEYKARVAAATAGFEKKLADWQAIQTKADVTQAARVAAVANRGQGGPGAEPITPPQEIPAPDLGPDFDELLQHLEGMAQAAQHVAPPGGTPVPPGTTFFGGGGEGGGPIPVIVQNWPPSLSGEAQVGGQQAAQGVVPPSKDMERMFQTAVHEGFKAAADDMGWQPGAGAAAAPAGKPKPKRRAPQRGAQPNTYSQELRQAAAENDYPDPTVTAAIEQESEERLGQRKPGGVDIAALRKELRDRQTFAQQAVELSPARAVATAAGQVASNLPGFGGRSSILGRQRVANRATAAAESEFKKLTDAEQALELLERRREGSSPRSKKYAALTREITVQTKAVDRLAVSYGGLATKAAGLQKDVAGATDIMRSFGAGVVGTIAGQILFQATLGAVQGGLAAFHEILGPIIERTTGYGNAAREMTGALSDQARQSSGATKQITATAIAQAGFSKETYDAIGPLIETRVQTEASNKALQERQKQLAAAAQIQRQNNQRGGADAGLYQTTGGLNILGVDTPFFGTPSTQEVIGHELGRVADPGLRNISQTRAPSLRLDNPGDLANVLNPFAGNSIFNGINPFDAPAAEQVAAYDESVKALELFNEAVEKGGLSTGKLVMANEEAAKASADLFRQAGFEQIASQLKEKGLAVEGVTTPQQAQAYVMSYQKGGLRPDPGVLLAGAEDSIKATIAGIQQGLSNQLQIFNPANQAVRLAAQPLPEYGSTFNPAQVTGIGGQFGGVPQSAKDSFKQYQSEAQAAIDAVNAKAAQGRQVLTEQLGVPETVLNELSTLGARIEGINKQQRGIQLDVQYSQFNRQLYLANRQLADLAGLTGRAGASEVGMLERQQLLLGRRGQLLSIQSTELGLQSQALSNQSAELGQQLNYLQLAQQQRQVNFRVAMAGFTAPGATPEERAARIEEAKVQARFEQTQLDFQKQQLTLAGRQLAINREQYGLQQQSASLAQAQYANQVALQDAMNERAYQDQGAAIAEMQKAFDASMQIAALEELKGVLSAQRDQVAEDLNAYMEAGGALIKAQADFSTQLMAQTGNFTISTVNQVTTFFNRASDAFESSGLGRFLLGGGSMPSGSGGYGGGIDPATNRPRSSGPQEYAAEGYLGKVSSPYTMTVGEAGTEMVAVLRNPRQLSATGMGGGGGFNVQLNIQVTGNTLGSETDADELAAKISRRVQDELGQQASLLGLGR